MLLLLLPALPLLLIYLLIICIVIGVAYYLINTFLPDPFRRWAIAVLIVLAAILVIYWLLGLVGSGGRL